MSADDELLHELGAALQPPRREPPTAAVEALRAAAVDQQGAAVARPGAVGRRRFAVGLLAAAAAIAGFAGAQAADQLRGRPAEGVEEFAARLRSGDGARAADVEGTRVGEGRILRLTSDDLPILPKGEFYEVWFVGPNDAPGSPNRISAGTFHPDEQGRTDIELTAAVDPTILPVLEITAEPGDGDPRPSGPPVLRTQLVVRG